MTFLSPEWLWLLALLPPLPVLYVLALRRRAADALRFPDMDLVRQAAAGRRAWRRHVPPALLFLGAGRDAAGHRAALGDADAAL